MFEIHKSEIKVYWKAGLGYIQETLESENAFAETFTDETKAFDAAARKVRAFQNLKLDEEKERFYGYNSIILNVRALWNSKIRKALIDNENEIKRLKTEMCKPVDIIINRLPESFTVQGDRLKVGSTIYELNQDSLTWAELTVIREQLSISVWDNKMKTTYGLSNEHVTDSLLTSHIFRRKFYTNLLDLKKDVSVAAEAEITRLQNMLRKTQE